MRLQESVQVVLAQQENNMKERSMRDVQLIVMGIVALTLPILVLLCTMAIYGLPFPMSISETATIANQASFILPYCLGMLSIFALSYAFASAQSDGDAIATFVMWMGFTMVALQPCSALKYITVDKVGAFGLTVTGSGFLHNVGAIMGFGALIYWILFCFTKSNKPKGERTPRKNLRNKIYYGFGLTMVACLIVYLLNIFGVLGTSFPLIFVLETIILGFSGIACLIKGGLAFADKEK